MSSVVQNPTTDTLVFQTHPTVEASDVMVASPANHKYCLFGREDHLLASKEFLMIFLVCKKFCC